jgi:hypothetical protein
VEHLELEKNKVGDGSVGLYKTVSGFIFDDFFASFDYSRWTPSPSTAITYTEGNLALHHSDIETTVLFDLPTAERSLLIEVTADYIPTLEGDEGGIVVMATSEDRLEFVESLHTTTAEYSRWRAKKHNDTWSFYADRGYGWEMFDYTTFIASKAGIILKNNDPSFIDLNLRRILFCKGDTVKVGNLATGYTAYLCDTEGYTVAESTVQPGYTGVDLTLPTIPYDGILKVFDVDGEQLAEFPTSNIYGGDVFLFGTDLEVWWNGEELATDTPTWLGAMYNGVIEVKMELKNPTTNTWADQISLGIKQYMDKFGYQWADVALDIDGEAGEYSDRIELGALAPDESKFFWVKVVRDGNYFGIEPTFFNLDINHV